MPPSHISMSVRGKPQTKRTYSNLAPFFHGPKKYKTEIKTLISWFFCQETGLRQSLKELFVNLPLPKTPEELVCALCAIAWGG